MIIFIPAAKTLVDFLDLDETLEIPNSCPECENSLWRHGKRYRVCESLQMCVRLEIQRLLCNRCRKTFSLMPTFLEPGIRFERQVTEIYISEFSERESTYREVAWSESDGERNDASASVSRVFRSVSRALTHVAEDVLNFHQQTLKSLCSHNHNPTITGEENSTTAPSVKSQSKQQQLKLLTLLLTQLRRLFGNEERAICFAYRSLCLGFPLPTPHCLQHALF